MKNFMKFVEYSIKLTFLINQFTFQNIFSIKTYFYSLKYENGRNIEAKLLLIKEVHKQIKIL